MEPFSDARILEAWRKNAQPWTQAVRQASITSRVLATDAAIVQTVLAHYNPQVSERVIDLGCGEGWLSRILAAQGLDVLGLDAVPELIEQAQGAGGGADYRMVSYEDIVQARFMARAQIVVCNFSLLGGEIVDALCRALPVWLAPQRRLVIQTLHPLIACGDLPYEDGWRPGSWAGCEGAFSEPAPWYFRTLTSWVHLLTQAGFTLLEVREPLHPQTGRPASVIFVAQRT
jgi:2-polyprenyl-3-methyl-5-hydroxy-6-metoxy-1,4-benzoquinol methylase